MKKHSSLFVLILMAAAPFPAHAAPPGNEKLIESFVGTWVGEGTAIVPGEAPEKYPNRMECKAIASGSGVECASEGKASIGELTQTCLLAFDAATQFVHYMCVSNLGEIHDHKGRWIDDHTIQYEPYEGTMGGTKVTEYLTTTFAEDHSLFHSSRVEMEGGITMTFEFRASKQASK